jgi:hypothetical protein
MFLYLVHSTTENLYLTDCCRFRVLAEVLDIQRNTEYTLEDSTVATSSIRSTHKILSHAN